MIRKGPFHSDSGTGDSATFDSVMLNAELAAQEGLEPAMENLKQKYHLNDKQGVELINWALRRLESFREKKTYLAEVTKRRGSDPTLVQQEGGGMDEPGLIRIIYIVANERARQMSESERLNPYLLTKGGMKNELHSRLNKISQTPDKKLVLVAFDLDDFKIINDLWGHQEGDKLLTEIGSALEEATRENDVAAHYSGDEFGFLLEIDHSDKLNDQEIQNIVKRIITEIIEKIQGLVKRRDEKKQEFSAGYSIIDPLKKEKIEVLMEQADKASMTSKTLRALNEIREIPTNSERRIVNGRDIDRDLAGYSAEEIRRATLMCKLRRPMHDAYPKLDPIKLSEMIHDFIKLLDQLNVIKDVNSEEEMQKIIAIMYQRIVFVKQYPDIQKNELDELTKEFTAKLGRTQQDNALMNKFFADGDKRRSSIPKKHESETTIGTIQKIRSFIASLKD